MTKQLVLVVLLLALAGGVGQAAGAIHTTSVDITTTPTGSTSFNYRTGEFTITGGDGLVTVKMQQTTGTATLTAPKVVGQFAGQKLARMIAYGPMHLEDVTPPDAQGNNGSKIVASADNRAEFSDAAEKVVLYGNAQADYVSLPETADSMRAHFTGEEIEADLNTGSLTVTKGVHITAETPLNPKGTPAPK